MHLSYMAPNFGDWIFQINSNLNKASISSLEGDIICCERTTFSGEAVTIATATSIIKNTEFSKFSF